LAKDLNEELLPTTSYFPPQLPISLSNLIFLINTTLQQLGFHKELIKKEQNQLGMLPLENIVNLTQERQILQELKSFEQVKKT
jgi:hypothetical protein